ncbi:MAG TPA: PAS domain-containing protein, partial [Bdellovibrionales bacterium]|nr:PAS domain-containing protein [Bdellovibrionales bacterium]
LRHLGSLKQAVSTERGRQFVQTIEASEAEHQKLVDNILERRSRGTRVEDLTADFDDILRPKRHELWLAINEFVNFEGRLVDQMSADSNLAAERVRTTLLLTSALAFLLLAVIAFVLLRTTQRLGVSERRFLDLVNKLDHSIVWEATAQPFRFNFMSERTQFLLGLPQKEFLDRPETFFNYIHEHDRASVRQMLEKARSTGIDQRVDHRMHSIDGKEIWVQSGVHVRRDSRGREHFYGLTVDITPSKNVERELKQSRDRLTLALQGGRMGSFDWDVVRDEHVWSPETESIFGFVPPEAPGTMSALMGIIHEDDRAQARGAMEAALQSRKMYESRYRIVRPDGEIRWVAVRGRPYFDEDGRPVRVLGVAWDITDEKTSEEKLKRYSQDLERLRERFELALQGGGIGIFEFDPEKKAVSWSETMYALYDVGPEFDPTFESWPKMIHPDDRARVLANIDRVIESRDDGYENEYRIITGAGETKWVFVKARVHRDHTGRAYSIIGVAMDVTAERHATESQRSLIDSLHEEREVRERFVNMLTHDLRTPLAAAKMSAQLMARQLANPEALVSLSGRLIENINRMEAMIRDLLDANLVKAGKRLTLDFEPCHLNELVQKIVDDMTLIHGDRFRVRAQQEIHGVWNCGGLRRVIENLVNNAIKYGSPNGLVTITFEQRAMQVSIRVHNEGEPLPEDERGRLFDLFARAPRDVRIAGWGIGLTLVRGLTEAHGGTVNIHTDESGTSFEVILPVNAAEHSQKGPYRPAQTH